MPSISVIKINCNDMPFGLEVSRQPLQNWHALVFAIMMVISDINHLIIK